MECLVTPEMELRLPRVEMQVEEPPGWAGVLADPGYGSPGPVDMILGAGVMALIIGNESVLHRGIRFQASRLGWLIFGEAGGEAKDDFRILSVAQEPVLETLVQRFWELDQVPDRRVSTRDEQECARIFREGVSRDGEGRYIVRIPTRPEITELGSTRTAALRRFRSIERRFERDPEFKDRYVREMEMMMAEGFMKVATDPPGELVYYLPHHAVLIKFRIVFDASCKADCGRSLNEMQYIGERLQDDLFTLILRYRSRLIAITADIRKMYLQVKVPRDQWDLQRIFWRGPDGSLREYWLTRVTFGMASAPYCAVRAMQRCAEDHAKQFPLAAAAVLKDFYMDDCLTGADTEEDARALVKQLEELLSAGGFTLGKFQSNAPGVVPAVEDEKEFAEAEEGKVLGLRWLTGSDELSFRWRGRDDDVPPTKRGLLRDLAQVFDPLGVIGPVTLTGKIMVRDLHQGRFDWDAELPSQIVGKWSSWRAELRKLQDLRIPRHVDMRRVTFLEGYADASELAYGAVVYAVVREADGSVVRRLLAARSRVAPGREITIPRLELCAALLLAKLMSAVSKALDWQGKELRFWSDSRVALSWIRQESSWKIFVHNRVQKIRELTDVRQWAYVPTTANPADILSRGAAPAELLESRLWWNGPEQWEEQPQSMTGDETEQMAKEEKQQSVVVNVVAENQTNNLLEVLDRSSSFGKVVRILCWVRRFLAHCRDGRRKNAMTEEEKWVELRQHRFTAEEEQRATVTWVSLVQRAEYRAEVDAVSRGEAVARSSPLAKMVPFLGQDGVLRLLGRLEASPESFERKHQMLVPGGSRLATLIVQHAHAQTLHGGYQLMAAQVRELFWIPRLRGLCRTVVGKCGRCVRFSARPMEQQMGQLPEQRVSIGQPFQVSGVDYAGPFEVKSEWPRGSRRLKKWIAIFVCFKTKAVHLELVADLTSTAFLCAFARFTSLRGPCRELWSDNARTFGGADNELKRMVRSWEDRTWREAVNGMKVEWRFISARSPHQGGLWEAAVRSAKHHLLRVVGSQVLNSEEWLTLLAQVSAVLNSRPLLQMSEDPDDHQYLTPQHLLSGGPAGPLVGRHEESCGRNPRSRFQLLQNLLQSFWQRWKEEYLQSLQARTKWRRPRENLKAGQLVILVEDDAPPARWRLGLVKKVIPGVDGLVRNATVTVAGQRQPLTRAVQKLVLLPGTG